MLTLEPADDAGMKLSVTAHTTCEQKYRSQVLRDKRQEFAPLLVDVEALLSLMRQLLKTAESPDAIVAPAKLVDFTNELWVQM